MSDEPVLGDVDELALPELPDSVWMRLLANALDPDATRVDDALIPVDLPPDDTAADADALAWADLPGLDDASHSAGSADHSADSDDSGDRPDDTDQTHHIDHPAFGGHQDAAPDPHLGSDPAVESVQHWPDAPGEPLWHTGDDGS